MAKISGENLNAARGDLKLENLETGVRRTSLRPGGKQKSLVPERPDQFNDAKLPHIGLESTVHGTVGLAGIKNPVTVHVAEWKPLNTYLKDNKLQDLKQQLFYRATPSQRGDAQGPIGDCFDLSAEAAIEGTDPKLQESNIRLLGTHKASGVNVYGVIKMVPTDSVHAKMFQRAADDLVITSELPDPKSDDPTQRIKISKRSTPVWVLTTDEVPVAKDGTLDSSDIHIKGRGIVLSKFLNEKADAKLHGSYKELNQGGDPATALGKDTGAPAVTLDVKRHADPAQDLPYLVKLFQAMRFHEENSGGAWVFGTWGDAAPRMNETLAANDSIKRVLTHYPQYDMQGRPLPLGKGFFDPDFTFKDGAGDSDHNDPGANSDNKGRNAVGDHAFYGQGTYFKGEKPSEHERVSSGKDDFSKPGDFRVAFGNPWGSVRPDSFADLGKRDDGILAGQFLRLMPLVGNVSFGGRPRDQRKPYAGVTEPRLPTGVKSSFELRPGETPAKS